MFKNIFPEHFNRFVYQQNRREVPSVTQDDKGEKSSTKTYSVEAAKLFAAAARAGQPAEKNEARKLTAMDRLHSTIQKLEKSDIADGLTELLATWCSEHIAGSDARETFLKKVKENGGKNATIGNLLEAMGEIDYKPFERTDEGTAQYYMSKFDVAFQWALSSTRKPNQKEDRAKINRLISRFKQIVR
jgi:hypothetical protein